MAKPTKIPASAGQSMVVKTAAAPTTVAPAPTPPGQTSATAKATSVSNQAVASRSGIVATYTLTAGDVGMSNISLGGVAWNILEQLGRPLETADIGHSLFTQLTTDGWTLSLV